MLYKKCTFLSKRLVAAVVALWLCVPAFAFSPPENGVIMGKVVDAESGDPLPGVNVIIQATNRGAATDLDGKFKITRVPKGRYSIIVSMIGYSRMKVDNVEVIGGQATTLDFSLSFEAVAGEEVVIEAKALRNSEGALLKERQKASAVSDAISAEIISRSASGDAAEAMSHGTGASSLD